MNILHNEIQPPDLQKLTRPQLLVLLRSAITHEAYQFAKQIALPWLAYYPGDLLVSRLFAQVLFLSGSYEQALLILHDLNKIDPEDTNTLELLLLASQAADSTISDSLSAKAFALGIDVEFQTSQPSWVHDLRKARLALMEHEYTKAGGFIHNTLVNSSPNELVAITHLRISVKNRLPKSAIQDLAAHYHQNWPTCIPIALMYAEALTEGCESEKAVALIHQISVQDVAGEVVLRYWGPDHPYRRIWPEDLTIPLEISIPAKILSAVGWNLLTDGLDSNHHTAFNDQINELPQNKKDLYPDFNAIPESLLSIQAELEQVAARLKMNHLSRADGRFPVYIIFSTRKGLENKYGQQVTKLETSMSGLVSAIRKRIDWGAEIIFADDPKCMGSFGLQPVKHNDPWALKLALVDLDKELAKRGEMIGAVLIVGGPEVIPYHHLPNPVDDIDDDVPSDNPYSTRDENYFVPEWLIGRLPGGARKDVEPLIRLLSNITNRHTKIAESQPWYQRIWTRISTRFNFRIFQRSLHKRPSWGSTAAIWRRASISVFRPIGPPHAMHISPPAQGDVGYDHNEILPASRLGYFNLHGLSDASEWFGQRDPTEPSSGEDYPIALRPQDVVNSGRAPQIIFSEACYGAHVNNKDIEESIALKFLVSGSHVVVGSTSTAYGSISPPLIAADLLGHTFWKFLQDGLTTGESLKRAKIQMAREMLRRQGYLDSEDQKTLISFVHFGDPLAQLSDFYDKSKPVYRPLKRPGKIRTICDRSTGICQETLVTRELPTEVMAQVKHIVGQYLPGMQNAEVSLSNEIGACSKSCSNCSLSQLGDRQKNLRISGRKIITLSKNIPSNSKSYDGQASGNIRIHRHYARMTLDKNGKLIKLAVSR